MAVGRHWSPRHRLRLDSRPAVAPARRAWHGAAAHDFPLHTQTPQDVADHGAVMIDDDAERPKYHPKVAALLERDAIPLSKLADLVGLDARTIARWGLNPETEERAAKYRRLDALIEGRARAVRADRGAWMFEELGAGIPQAEIRGAIDDLRRSLSNANMLIDSLVERLDSRASDGVGSGPPEGGVGKVGKVTRGGLSPDLGGGIQMTMSNPELLKRASKEVWERSRDDGLVSLHKKVAKDHGPRLDHAAKSIGMDASDLLRAILEVALPPLPQ